MSERVKMGDRVQINYTGKLADGTVFDSSEGREPLAFEAGSEQIIPGMSNAVMGMQVGEARTVDIPPDQAYGAHNPELLVRVPTDQLPENAKEGDILSDGQPGSRSWIVMKMTEEASVLDGNHPLAGKTLTFDLTLVAIG